MTYEFYTVNPEERSYTNYFTDQFFSDLVRWDKDPDFTFRNAKNICMNNFFVREDTLWNISLSELSQITWRLNQCFPKDNKKKFLNFFNKCKIFNDNKSDTENLYAMFRTYDYLVILCKEDYFGSLFIICEVYKISELLEGSHRMIKEFDHEIKVRPRNQS